MNPRKLFNQLILYSLLLLSGMLVPATGTAIVSPARGFNQSFSLPEAELPVIEGQVERIISEMQSDGLITSQAIIRVDTVLQGTLPAHQVTVHYLGGTVGDLTLVVSEEPRLAEGMQLQAKLTPLENGGYRIANPDTDLSILSPGIGPAYVFTGRKWPGRSLPVPIRINANTADVPGVGEQVAVQSALNAWTNTACSYFVFQYQAGSCTVGPTRDGVNCVAWTGASGGGALARAHTWYSGSTTLETDVVFYDERSWSTSPGPGQFDVESVALHELGHSLGLAHENSNSAIVMYFSITSGLLKRTLHPDDVNGICALYPIGAVLPSSPSNLQATSASSSRINLSWVDNSNNESGFIIERSPNGNSSWSQIGSVGNNITSYANSGLSPSTTYYYRVKAYNASGNSSYSNVASSTTDAAPPVGSEQIYLPIILRNG